MGRKGEIYVTIEGVERAASTTREVEGKGYNTTGSTTTASIQVAHAYGVLKSGLTFRHRPSSSLPPSSHLFMTRFIYSLLALICYNDALGSSATHFVSGTFKPFRASSSTCSPFYPWSMGNLSNLSLVSKHVMEATCACAGDSIIFISASYKHMNVLPGITGNHSYPYPESESGREHLEELIAYRLR